MITLPGLVQKAGYVTSTITLLDLCILTLEAAAALINTSTFHGTHNRSVLKKAASLLTTLHKDIRDENITP